MFMLEKEETGSQEADSTSLKGKPLIRGQALFSLPARGKLGPLGNSGGAICQWKWLGHATANPRYHLSGGGGDRPESPVALIRMHIPRHQCQRLRVGRSGGGDEGSAC